MKKNVILTLTIFFLAVQVSAFEFCDDGTVGESNLRLISADDMLKENSKEWTWQTLQEIEIEARVENRNDEDGTYIIEAIFKDGDDTIKIAEDSDDLKEEFSLSANERDSISLEFTVDEDADAQNYDVYIKFYKEGEEETECVENSEEELEIERIEVCEDDEVSKDELEITDIKDKLEDNENKWDWAPGNDIRVSLDLENKDYSQRDFEVELIFFDNNGEEVFLTDNHDNMIEETTLDEDEDDNINFNFKLKSNIEEAEYTLYAKAYDKSDDDICTSLKAEGKSNPILIKVEKEERKVIVTNVEGPESATTSSQAQYTATITNFGSVDEDRVLAIIYNYQLDLNEKVEIQNLDSGEEETVTFNISIPENASLSRYSLLFATEYEYNEEQDYYRSASDDDDDIKHIITIAQGEVEETKEETQNETIVEEAQNETNTPITTTITGNAIGIPNESPNWIVLIILIILATIGIVFFFKKPPVRKSTKIEAPHAIRRHTVKV
jgi:hypothetical protein